jgi:hypothetical protein
MPHLCYAIHMTKRSAHEAALSALLSPAERATHGMQVEALLARNKMLQALEAARQEASLNKTELARLAGLDPSAVRRMLTAQTANPTTDNAFRLFHVMGARIDVTLPSGECYRLVSGPSDSRVGRGSRKRSTRSVIAAEGAEASRRSVRASGRSAATGGKAPSRGSAKRSSAVKPTRGGLLPKSKSRKSIAGNTTGRVATA